MGASPETAPKKKSGSFLFKVTILVALVAVVVGAGYWIFGRRAKVVAAAQPHNVDRGVKATMHFESFTVNLADKDQSSFLRISIDLGLGKDLPGGKEGDTSGQLSPLIRDTFLGVLNTWSSDQLLAPEGKSSLKEALLKALRERVPELGVKEVYFTDFLVQR